VFFIGNCTTFREIQPGRGDYEHKVSGKINQFCSRGTFNLWMISDDVNRKIFEAFAEMWKLHTEEWEKDINPQVHIYLMFTTGKRFFLIQ
jgi:hypothetical protein